MSNQMFASAQVAPGKHGSAGTPKEVPSGDQPTVRPDQKPAEVAPVSKS